MRIGAGSWANKVVGNTIWRRESREIGSLHEVMYPWPALLAKKQRILEEAPTDGSGCVHVWAVCYVYVYVYVYVRAKKGSPARFLAAFP